MTRIFIILFNVHATIMFYTGLTDGSQIVENFEGSVKLGSKLTLYHVLYVPNLKCNLISMSLLFHFNPEYSVYISKDSFVILDYTKLQEIGVGNLDPWDLPFLTQCSS